MISRTSALMGLRYPSGTRLARPDGPQRCTSQDITAEGEDKATLRNCKPEWFTKVLGLSEKINHVARNVPIKPVDYLKKANYTEVIERGHGPPEPVVR
ncbi:hypothetical protein evm_006770 [Chilo suppressalis]|nr:hypothetical protein evm_006770 [Chilo suppressalis]